MLKSKLEGRTNLQEKPQRLVWRHVANINSARDLCQNYHLPIFIDTGTLVRTTDVFEHIPRILREIGPKEAHKVLHQEYGRNKALSDWDGPVWAVSTIRDEISRTHSHFQQAYDEFMSVRNLPEYLRIKAKLVRQFRGKLLNRIATTTHEYDDDVRLNFLDSPWYTHTYSNRISNTRSQFGDHDCDLYLSASTFGNQTTDLLSLPPIDKVLMTSDSGFTKQGPVPVVGSKEAEFFVPPAIAFLAQDKRTGLTSVKLKRLTPIYNNLSKR